MNPKAFAVLALGTILAVGAAIGAVLTRPGIDAERHAGEPLLPDLAKRANEIARLEVTERGDTLVIARTDQGWVLPDKGSYPARLEPIREAVASLARLSLVEAKTDRPDRHGRLGLEDPTAETSTSRRLVLKNAAGDVLADIILGKPSFGVGGAGGLYVRRQGEAQSWLVAGQVRLPYAASGWMDTQILDVDAGRVLSVVLSGGGKASLKLTRADEDWALEPAPKGRAPERDKAGRLASLVAALSFDDVRPARDVDATGGRHAEIATKDGLILRLSRADAGTEAGDEPWVLISVEARAETAKPDADAINKRTAGYAFRLPSYKASLLDLEPGEMLATAPES